MKQFWHFFSKLRGPQIFHILSCFTLKFHTHPSTFTEQIKFFFSSLLFREKKERKQKYYRKKDKQNTIVFVVYIAYIQCERSATVETTQYVYNLFARSPPHTKLFSFSVQCFSTNEKFVYPFQHSPFSANPNDQ